MSAKKIGENQWLVDVDSRGRVSLGKIVRDQELFRVSEHAGEIYLEPVTAYTDAELQQLRYDESQRTVQEMIDNE